MTLHSAEALKRSGSISRVFPLLRAGTVRHFHRLKDRSAILLISPRAGGTLGPVQRDKREIANWKNRFRSELA